MNKIISQGFRITRILYVLIVFDGRTLRVMICSYLLTSIKRLHKIKDGPEVRRISSQREVAEFLASPLSRKKNTKFELFKFSIVKFLSVII